jgi:DNA-binding beta-propeller fold protein YncE
MRKNVLVFAAGLAAAATLGLGGSHDNGRRGTVWVTHRDANELTVFDAATGGVVKTVPVGLGAHNVVVSSRARKAYVMNELENTVSVLSASTLGLLEKIPLGPRPHHAKVSRDGRTVYIGLFGTNRIATIDTATDSPREYVSSDNPAARAHAPYPSRKGGIIYVPHEMGSDEVTALDAETGAIIFSVVPGLSPSEVLPTRNGRLLYVSMRAEGKVKVIDLASRLVTGEVIVGLPGLTGAQPESLLLTPDERTLVVSLRAQPAQLVFVDTESLMVIETLQIGGDRSFGDLAVMSSDGRYVYATFNEGTAGFGGVAVVDACTRTLVETWAYPRMGRPHGIFWSSKKLRRR